VIKVQVLGTVTLVHEGERHDVSSCRARTVLALLALSRRTPLSFDYLMDELWMDKSLGNRRNALQASVVRLRRLLERITGQRGDQLIRTVGGGYVLDVRHDAVDANRFLDLADQGARQVHRDPGEAIELLEQALGLWRGSALSGVSDGVRCRLEAACLDGRRITAREDLITAKLGIGDGRAVVSELLELTTEYPERERFSEQLMLALYRCGRQTEALDVFHRARKKLASELGLEPGRALHQLYQAILVHDQVLG
jgi:DNA-binding SARP family transcriptional activator